MKTITKLLLGGMMAAFCCSVGKAQTSYSNSLTGATLIYSNAFNGSAVNITNTTINYSAAIYGGSNNPAWIDVLGGLDTNAFFANGTMGTLQGDSAILPFKPTTNLVYTLTATVNFSGNPGSWVGAGFAQNYAHQGSGNGRFTDAVTGYDWGILTESSGAFSYFGGPKTTSPTGESATFKPTTGTHTMTYVLDTTWNENPSNRWTVAGFVDGVQAGTSYTYPSNPTIAALGLTETFLNAPNEFQWLSLTLSAAQLVIVREPATANVNEGASFTNTVVAAGTPPFFYQWYNNGASIADATNASLVINPVLPGNAGTNYYVIVTNSAYGAVTSTPAALTVSGPPMFATADPIAYTNVMTLFGGTNNGVTTYAGSSPRFLVSATGLQPMSYFWQTNGVSVGGATNTTFTFPNTQWNSPTNFTCIASNSISTATNTWLVQYIPPPTAPYPVTVMSFGPVGYWRLNEVNNDPDQYNNGEICNDYISGNNGIYTNTELAQTPGYSAADPNETAALFGPDGSPASCDANSIGTNVDFSGPSNAEFTVSVWANGGFQNGGTEPRPGGMVAKCYFNAEEFTLDDGASGGDARFEVRNAAGTAFNANSTVQLGGNDAWVHLVGVCDESNGVVNLYINGILAGQANIPPGSGVEPDSLIPIMIGARSTSATSYGDNQFKGALNDVALFNYALSGAQVAQLYGGAISPYLVPPFAVTNIEYTPNSTVTIPAAAFGTPPIGYYWTNLTAGTVIASGTTNLEVNLNATLTIPNISANLNSNELELVVTNAAGSTNYFVMLYTPPTGQTLDYANAIVYSNAFNLPAISIGGGAATVANGLVGGSNTTWICTFTNSANQNGTVYANGTLGTNAGCALVPFTPEPGYIYTMSGSLSAPSTMQNWVAMGFTQFATQTNNPGFARFTDSPVNGYGWMYVENSSSDFFGGPETGAGEGSISTVPLPGSTAVIMQLVLNTMTNGGWTESAFVNSTQVGTTAVFTSPPPIAYAGIGQNQFASAPPTGIQWNYWTLTQVAPNGVPPYLFAPLPPTNVMLLPNQSLAISAKTFGSAPLGYYWTDVNTGDVLESGSTNNLSPLAASLNVPSVPGDWNGNLLELTVTNAYGTNISLVKLSVISTNTAPILPVMTNGDIFLTWPIDHLGWQLQAQTNSISIGLSTNWVNVAGSTATNLYVVPINLTNGSVFYRLKY